MEYNEHDTPPRTHSYGRLVHGPKWFTTSPEELAKPPDPDAWIHPSKTTVTRRNGKIIRRNVSAKGGKGQTASSRS